MNVELRNSILFVKNSRAKRHPQFVNQQSSFDKVSYERRLWPRASSLIKKKLWLCAIVGSATVPTSFGGHGSPPYDPKHLKFHTRSSWLNLCSGGVYPRQEFGAYHLYTHLVDSFVDSGVTRRLGGDKPRHYIFVINDVSYKRGRWPRAASLIK